MGHVSQELSEVTVGLTDRSMTGRSLQPQELTRCRKELASGKLRPESPQLKRDELFSPRRRWHVARAHVCGGRPGAGYGGGRHPETGYQGGGHPGAGYDGGGHTGQVIKVVDIQGQIIRVVDTPAQVIRVVDTQGLVMTAVDTQGLVIRVVDT